MQPEKTQKQFETSVYFWGFLFRDHKEPLPKLVSEINKFKITKISSGGFFFIAANDEGEAWGWGVTKHSRFGILGQDQISVPRPLGLKFRAHKISAGNWHSIMSDKQGNLHGVGHNKYGCLGLGHFQNVDTFNHVELPFKIEQLSAGDGFSMIISNEKSLYGCGLHTFHGHSSKDNLNKFHHIGKQNKFIRVNCGFTHSLAIDQTGAVFSWGQGTFHQLGHGNKNNVKTPKKIQGLSQVKAVDISCTRGQKYSHSMAVGQDGSVYTWGSGYKGKLGHHDEWTHADPADEPKPRLMKTIDFKAKKVFAGGIHSGVMDQNGNIYTFGCGSDGRIGHPQSTDHRYLYRQGIPRKLQTLSNCQCIDASFSYYQNICVGIRK